MFDNVYLDPEISAYFADLHNYLSECITETFNLSLKAEKAISKNGQKTGRCNAQVNRYYHADELESVFLVGSSIARTWMSRISRRLTVPRVAVVPSDKATGRLCSRIS